MRLEAGGRAHVAHEVRRVDLERRVVAPRVGEADLRREPLELLERPPAGLRRHPLEAGDGPPVRLDEVPDEHVHLGLGGGAEVSLDVDAADGLAHGSLDQRDAALPPHALLGRARERAAVEVEGRLREGLRQQRRVRADDLPAEPIAERRDLGVGQQRAEALGEARLAQHDLVERGGGRLDGVAPDVEVGAGGLRHERAELGPRDEVVGGLAVAGADVVPVGGGDAGLEVEDPVGTGGRVVEAGEVEHALDERAVRRADVRVAVLAVVALVGEADAALLDLHDVALGVARVVVDEEAEQAGDVRLLERAERAEEGRHVGDGGRRVEVVADGLDAEALDALLVHEAREQVAGLALLGAGLGVDGLLDDHAHGVLGRLRELVERAPAGLVVGDLRAVEPAPVHVEVEVVLRAHPLVQLVGADPGRRCLGAHGHEPRGVGRVRPGSDRRGSVDRDDKRA